MAAQALGPLRVVSPALPQQEYRREPDAYVELGQDGTGCATVEGLEPGDYTVWAAWRGGLVRGPDVRVDDSGPHLARVELTGEASLSGAIQKRTPGGLEDVTWFLGLELRHETLPIGTHALVDGDGRHSFPVLPPGRWRLGDRAQRVPVQLRPGDNHRDVVVAPNLD